LLNINNSELTVDLLKKTPRAVIRKYKKTKWVPKVKKQEIQYLDHIFKNNELIEKWNLKERRIVGIDPGKVDLISCSDGIGRDANLFRYTQKQRAFEKKTGKYAMHRDNLKDTCLIYGGPDVKQIEQGLSELNSKSVYYIDYKRYFDEKLIAIAKVNEFYSDYMFRKLRLQTYQNTRKSEQNMINNFKKIYGEPDKVLIAIGDFEQEKHMKYRPPSIGKGIWDIFRRNGYPIFLIDEFRTSMHCSCCYQKNEQYMYHKNKKRKPDKNDVKLGYKKKIRKFVLSRGLIRCTNVLRCGVVWNRDVNAAKNIYKLAWLIVHGQDRIPELCRSTNNNNINQIQPPDRQVMLMIPSFDEDDRHGVEAI